MGFRIWEVDNFWTNKTFSFISCFSPLGFLKVWKRRLSWMVGTKNCIPYLWLMFNTKEFAKNLGKKWKCHYICQNCWELYYQLVKKYLLSQLLVCYYKYKIKCVVKFQTTYLCFIKHINFQKKCAKHQW